MRTSIWISPIITTIVSPIMHALLPNVIDGMTWVVGGNEERYSFEYPWYAHQQEQLQVLAEAAIGQPIILEHVCRINFLDCKIVIIIYKD